MTQSPPFVTVLMATYNNADYLPAAIESVLAQTMPDFELIVSDNASSDGTQAIGEHYAALDTRVKYFRNRENVGLVGNFNLCYQRSHPGSRYFIGLPSDDWWMPELLEELTTIAEANPEVTLVYSDIYRTEEDGTVINTYGEMLGHNHPLEGPHQAVPELYGMNYIPYQTAMLRREDFRRLSPSELPYDPEVTYTNDYFLWLTMMSRGARAYYLDKPLGYLRKHEGAHTMPVNIVARVRHEAKNFEKLEGIIPTELEPIRVKAFSDRLSSLAFLLLEQQQAEEARSLLQEATLLSPNRRLDLQVARLISGLPLSAWIRSQLWRFVLNLWNLSGAAGRRVRST